MSLPEGGWPSEAGRAEPAVAQTERTLSHWCLASPGLPPTLGHKEEGSQSWSRRSLSISGAAWGQARQWERQWQLSRPALQAAALAP